MRTIICKKCGAPIDADLGECPVCGAVYYILPKEDGDETRVWDAEAAHTAEEISSAIKREEMSGETKPLPELKPDKPAPADKKPETPSPSRRAPAGGKDPSGKGKSQPVKPAAKGPDKRLPNRSWIFVVTAAVLLAVLTVVLCVMSGVFDFGGGASKMPDLVGLTRDVAVDQLQAIGINPNIVYEESTEPDGVVLRQSPDEGAAVDNSTVVTLTVSSHVDAPDDSQDTQTVAVPDVMGLSYDQAVQRLRSAGLTAVVGAREHSAEAEDTVTRQSPLSGAMVSPGASVTLTLSLGPEEREYTVIITAGKGGSISPSGTVTVTEGDSLTLTVEPERGYELSELRIDGESVGAPDEYVLEDIGANHSVYAVFTAVEEQPEESAEPETSTPPLVPATPTDLN